MSIIIEIWIKQTSCLSDLNVSFRCNHIQCQWNHFVLYKYKVNVKRKIDQKFQFFFITSIVSADQENKIFFSFVDVMLNSFKFELWNYDDAMDFLE